MVESSLFQISHVKKTASKARHILILALGRQGQVGLEFEDSLVYRVRFRTATATQ